MERAGRPYATAASVTRLGVVSVLSALSGLAMEITLAWRFGASETVDAFRVSVLLLMLGQQIFVYTVWPNVLVPLIAEYRARGREKDAWHVARALAGLLATAAGVLSLVVFVWPEPFAHLLGPGLTGEARTTSVFLVRWFGLTFVPVVWIGLAASLLYARGIFSVRVWVQVLSNVAVVTMVATLGRSLGPSSLVAGVMLGSAVSCIVCVQMVRRLMREVGVPVHFTVKVDSESLGHVLRLAIPLGGLVVAGFWSSVVINRVLSDLPVSTLATFGYAWKMCQLASMGPSLVGAVLFPRFAQSRYGASSKEEFRTLCTGALRMGAFIAIPVTCICFFLRVPLVSLLFERGEFSAETAAGAAWLFGLLLLGVPASVAVDYVQKMLYATQHMWIPTGVQLVGALLLTVVGRTVVDRFGADGLAMTYVLLVWLSWGSLVSIFNRSDRAIRLGELGIFAIKVLSVAMVSAWLGSEVVRACGGAAGWDGVALGGVVAIGACLAAVIFLVATWLLRVPEARWSWRYLQWHGGVVVGRMQNALRG
jgi:putative peptidoglycan lipid II flippase